MPRSCQALLILIGIAREINDLLYDLMTLQPKGLAPIRGGPPRR